MSEESLNVRPYKRHIFVCTGSACAPETSPPLYQFLKKRLKELDLHQGSERIERSQCHCLGVCQGGPLAVVYPDGIWYQDLTEEKLERILQEHILGGKPVEEFQLEISKS